MKIEIFNRRAHPEGLTIDRWIAPDGWDHRRWNWPVEDDKTVRGSIVFQTGRGDFFEKYLESLAEWHQAGWNLCGFDWRGQSGSGRLLTDPSVGHIESFDLWVDDLDAFIRDWRSKMPGPHILMAHSMGGHLAMRYLVDRQPDLDGAILSAPMLRMISKPMPERLAHFVARQFVRFGFAGQHAWQENERPSLPGSSRQKLLTHDFERYADEDWWIDNSDFLRMGPPSWQWLVAAYRSSAAMFAEGAFEKVTIPILFVAAERDKLVSAGAIREAHERLPNSSLLMHPGSAHELLREVDAIRDETMEEVAAFLEERVKVPA